jgi:predicted nucleotidyltransferase component of viral defense system
VSTNGPARRWRGLAHLQQLLEEQPGGFDFAVRDFALLALAGELAHAFPGQLVFKGGFVLRHAHGHLRFSKDVDATRHAPPIHKLDTGAVARTIAGASIANVVQFTAGEPATDSARSLDFNDVRVSSTLFPATSVQVEVSYRERVVGLPVPAMVGVPYFEPFEILTLEPEEMAAEKLRTLAQRRRHTDLADLAVLLRVLPVTADATIARYATAKFVPVKQGRANRAERIERSINDFASDYDDVVRSLFPTAPDYRTARDIVWPRIKPLIP